MMWVADSHGQRISDRGLFSCPLLSARVDDRFSNRGKAHGQNGTVRGYQLRLVHLLIGLFRGD
jgi:hypothetical protein